jgi:hypothetical protein
MAEAMRVGGYNPAIARVMVADLVVAVLLRAGLLVDLYGGAAQDSLVAMLGLLNVLLAFCLMV